MSWETARLRRAKIRRGTKGSGARASRSTNAAKRPALATSRPRVRPDDQPASSPPTIPETASISAPVTSTAPGMSRCAGARSDGVGRQRGPGRDEDDDADRHVDQEDPVPRQQVGQDAAEEHPDGASARDHEAVNAHRLRPLGRVGEQAHDERQPDSGDGGAAAALHHPADDQDLRRRRQPARDGGEGEERRPREEDAAVAPQITQAPAEQQEAAVGQQVAVDHPGQ